MNTYRKIILDIETTGLNPNDGHRIIEIGCVEIIDGQITSNQYHVYINPEQIIMAEAYDIHGLSYEFLRQHKVFAEIADEFLAFIQDAVIVAHNAKFDIGFINYELEKLHKPSIALERVLDTLVLARRRFPGERVSLDALCKKCGISLSGRSKHSAILDANLLAKVYPHLLVVKQLDINLTLTYNLPAGGSKYTITILPTPEEQQAHTELLTLITNPLWYQS